LKNNKKTLLFVKSHKEPRLIRRVGQKLIEENNKKKE